MNGQIAAATNTALSLAKGDFVAFLDIDDELAAHALYTVADALQRNPALDLIFSDEDKIDEQGTRLDALVQVGLELRSDACRKTESFNLRFIGVAFWKKLGGVARASMAARIST